MAEVQKSGVPVPEKESNRENLCVLCACASTGTDSSKSDSPSAS